MSLIADGILIVTCLTTAVYCYVLSRRLARLSNTDEGIGKQIAQMNAGLEETRAAVSEIRATTKSASDKLTKEVAQARKIASQLARLNEKSQENADRRYQAEPANEPKPAPNIEQADSAASGTVEKEAPIEESLEVPELDERVVPSVVPPEVDEADVAEMDAGDASIFSEGRQQLGFLPEIDVTDELDEDVSLGGSAPGGQADDLFADDDVADLTKIDEIEAEVEAPNGVLKVERMAL